MEHVKLALTSFFETHYRNINAAAQDDFQAFIDCLEKDWEVTESELFLIKKMLEKELQYEHLEASTAIQLLTYIRLCAVRNNINERAAKIRERLKDQEK